MSLIIKNDGAGHRAAKGARLTGESMMGAVAQATQLLAIGKDCAARLNKRFCKIDHGDLFYGEDGSPK